MEKQPQSFGEQAARFSLYAPFMAIGIGLFANGSKDQPSVALSLFAINVALIAAGLCLGLVALSSIRRYGRKRILGRAIIGVIFNSLFIAAMLTLLLPLMLAGRMKQRLAGRWSMQTTHAQVLDNLTMTLDQSGKFNFESSRGGHTDIALAGTWVLTKERVLGVNIEQVTTGDPSAAGKHMGLGTVQSVDEKQMVLKTDHGDEVYARLR